MTDTPAIDAKLVAELAERARAIDLAQLDARLRASGGCARPIRLRGQIEVGETGGNRRVWSTDSEPDGVLRRRAAIAARPSVLRARSATARTPTT